MLAAAARGPREAFFGLLDRQPISLRRRRQVLRGVSLGDHEGADRYEQQLRGILQLVPEREGWKPPVVRTVATENKGVHELAHQIALFRAHFDQAHDRKAREVSHWKEWILQLLEVRLMERVVGEQLGEGELDRIASLVAERKMDPYGAVNQILARAGLGDKP